MKHELIKTTNYLIIVDDSEIKVGDWMYLERGSTPSTNPRQIARCEFEGLKNEYTIWKKVIAHLPINNSPILKGVPLLPLLPSGGDDVDKLAGNLLYGKYPYHPPQDSGYWKDMYKEGYNKAKEKYKFTEEDVIDFSIWRSITIFDQENPLTPKGQFELWKSLSPKMPTHFEWEWEMDCDLKAFDLADEYTPRTTTNSQGQVMACGKYIY